MSSPLWMYHGFNFPSESEGGMVRDVPLIDLVKDLKVSVDVLRVLTRLVGLINTPQDGWTDEDHQFFRRVKKMVQERWNDQGR